MKKRRKGTFFNWDNLFATFVVIGVIEFLPILFTIDFLDPIQNTIEDFNASDVVFSQVRNYDKIETDEDIVLVNIGYLNRKGIAGLINIINRYDPKVIGIDTFFRKPKDEDLDSALARAFSKVENLVLVSELLELNQDSFFDSIAYSHSMFNKRAQTGYANFVIDNEDQFRVVRLVKPREEVNEEERLAFAVKLAKIYSPDKTEEFLARNNDVEAINFKRNIGDGKYLTLDIDDVFSNPCGLDFLKDKIVLLGFLGPDVKTMVFEDSFFTPMNENYLGKAHPDMYGVVVHANVISMILEGDFITRVHNWMKIVLTFLIIFANMALFYYIETRFENLYETANLFIIFGEIILVFVTMIYVFYWFNIEIGLTEVTLYGIIFSATGFELYHGSFKPIAKNAASNIYKKGLKRAGDKITERYGSRNEEGEEK